MADAGSAAALPEGSGGKGGEGRGGGGGWEEGPSVWCVLLPYTLPPASKCHTLAFYSFLGDLGPVIWEKLTEG